ncbi:MAG: DEAD/DEAH box helicase [Tannerella sp.]|jgi:superfamily II DNA or RNA helicase|nr:DEAD/DEAH box helicase [Tannerella sp.]
MKEKVILTLFKHAHWGYILQPVLVEGTSSGVLNVIHVISEQSPYFKALNGRQQQIVRYSDRYADEALRKSFSKEKTVFDFYKTAKPNIIEHYIRPIIERYHLKIAALLNDSGLDLYHRSGVKDRTLYASNRIHYSAEPVHVIFHFIRDDVSGLRYLIRLKHRHEMIALKNKSFTILCHEPAVVVVDNQLFVFEDIDSKKLLPFFTREFITVPAASERTYITKFVVNCVRHFEVVAEGLPVTEVAPSLKACLSLQKDLMNDTKLLLEFDYGSKRYFCTEKARRIVTPVIEKDQIRIEWFERDVEWEKSMAAVLKQHGLVQDAAGYFMAEGQDADSDHERTMIHWLQTHSELLEQFHFDQQLPDKKYFLGNVAVETQIDDQQDWFDVKCMVVIGEYRIPFAKFKTHILNYQKEYILPDHTIALLPDEWFSRYHELMYFGKRNGESLRLSKYYFPVIDAITQKPEQVWQEDAVAFEEIPAGIRARLRPYQQKGFSWLVYLYRKGYGGCLADDMGLGKTLQIICLLQYAAHARKDAGQEAYRADRSAKGQLTFMFEESFAVPLSAAAASLVVVPTSLLHNWQNELKRFAPRLKVYIYAGSKRQKIQHLAAYLNLFDVVLTTYGILRNDIEQLTACHFHCLILDESQQIKNPASLSFKAVRYISAMHRFILTGTPVENSLSDLWAQFEIINPGMLGAFASFKKAFIQPISRNDEEKEKALLRLIQPFIMRRTKQEVAPELPPLSEEVVYCDMSESQQTLYEQEKSRLRNHLIDEQLAANRQNATFMTLQGLTRLRLIANHPHLHEETFPGDSGKFEQVAIYLEMLRAEKHKVLVFSSFVKHLRLFADYFERRKWKYAWLTGEIQMKDREKEISRFMNEDAVNCFFISLKAGGVGLNLTAADYVFILDPWWNPASEMQAVARSHRIGQGNKVMVYRFISTNTIEEKIRKLQEGKSKLAETFVRSSNPLAEMSREEMEELLA